LIDLVSEDEFFHRAINVPMQPLQWDLAKRKGVDIIVRRDDLIDNTVSGNKLYKLFYNLQRAKHEGYQQLLSFGGAYSNHIYALAAAGKKYGFNTIGVIRGERPKVLSPTLQDAERWGMKLHFASRAEYYQKELLAELHESLEKKYGDFYSIPEGGANTEGTKGAKVIGWAIEQQCSAEYTAICLACGTGNTFAGIAAEVKNTVLGIIAQQQNSVMSNTNNWRLISGYHAGGYAKKLPRNLQNFQNAFEREAALKLDPVYTLKMCWGVAQLLAQNYWPRGSRLILIHTGGMQGRRGFNLDF
jgi:1-aminocyclopropane-1-carboxylate deaminase